MNENDISVGAFRSRFTMNVKRNVAFQMVRIVFTISDGTRFYVAAREGARSRALVFSNDSVSKPLAG